MNHSKPLKRESMSFVHKAADIGVFRGRGGKQAPGGAFVHTDDLKYRLYGIVIAWLAKTMRGIQRASHWLELADKPPFGNLVKCIRGPFVKFGAKFGNLCLKVGLGCLERREALSKRKAGRCKWAL